MTRIVYEPALPALELSGHAGAGPRGRDPVCAALSILLFTLFEAESAAQVRMRNGWCRVRGGDRRSYELIACGCRLLAEHCPAYVTMEVRP